VDSQLQSQVIRFVQVSSGCVKRSLDELARHRQAIKTASAQSPSIIQKMLDAGLIDQAQKTAAEKELSDPARTMSLLNTVVTKLAAAKVKLQEAGTGGGDRLGRPEKQASEAPAPGSNYHRGNSVIVGARSSEHRDSDRAILNGCGLSRLAT
jgi:hypothetical protein